MTDLATLRARAEAATPAGDLRRYENGGGRLAVWDGPSAVLIADFYNEADREFYAAANPQTILRLLDRLTEALDIIDDINGCHGCLDNGSTEDRETVERLRDALAERQAPR